MFKTMVLGIGVAVLLAAGCGGGAHRADSAGHEGHEHTMNEKGQWTCSHCGGDYDGPGKCKNDYCKMDLVRKDSLKK